MPLIRQKMIYRADLKANPRVLYLFGDNLARKGLGGQAKEMRGEPNALGIATKHGPYRTPHSYFDDKDYDYLHGLINTDMVIPRQHIRMGGVVVIPLDGLGTGLSEMPTRCPLLHDYLLSLLDELQSMANAE